MARGGKNRFVNRFNDRSMKMASGRGPRKYPDDITIEGVDSGAGYSCNAGEEGDTSFRFGANVLGQKALPIINRPKQKAPPLAMKNEAQG